MWYHTDVNDRILECPGTPIPPLHTPPSLQELSALSVIRSRDNFYRSQQIPTRIKDYITSLCEGLEVGLMLLCLNVLTKYLCFSCVQPVPPPGPRQPPATRSSHSRTHTWGILACHFNTGHALCLVPGRWRSPPGGSSSARPWSRTGSTRDMSGRA